MSINPPNSSTATLDSNTLDHGVRHMLDKRKSRQGSTDAVVYTGDWHDSIPRRLILDSRLTPTEKIVWQVLRTHASQPGQNGAWPSIGRLAKLTCVSRPTVQNAVDVLQASRWISVVRRIRNEQGAVIGNYYLLHGSPLPVHETMVVTPDYLGLLRTQSSMDGPSKKRVKEFALFMMKELKQNVQSEQKRLNKLDELVENMSVDVQEGEQSDVISDLEKAAAAIHEKQETAQEPQPANLVWPDSLKGYKKQAMASLANAPKEQRQGILNAVGKATNVRNPLAYLGAIIKKAKEGLFFDESAKEEQEEVEQSKLLKTIEEAGDAIKKGKLVTFKGTRVIAIEGVLISFEKSAFNAIWNKAKPDDFVVSEPPG